MSVPKTEVSKTQVEQISILENQDDVEIKPDAGPNRLILAQELSLDDLADAEKSLKKKLELRFLLTVWVILIMNYLDRNNIAEAKVSGIKETLKLISTQYSTAVAILFVGYVPMQISSNVFLS
ncbi:putative mfs transporter protein [Neofusicoccum parvum UCRNP2]|uniref:Putative mfs transporter protein n=1 Tax=Botryosphaeria parva (strain UCR-NP2) TaxID=1287680 RepID=R1EK97_BOTPV|nr:putative mfs transporter protein [Neofusicoccum parvum UCRNP2]